MGGFNRYFWPESYAAHITPGGRVRIGSGLEIQPPALPGVVVEDGIMAISFVTTTSYGSWLPGDVRGYVRRGVILPNDPELLEMSRRLMKGSPVRFSVAERERLFESLQAACDEFAYRLSDVTIESWHLHLVLFHGDDKIETVMGRVKTRMRQRLERGRIWTEGFCAEPLSDEGAILQVREYIARHHGCRMTDGRLVRMCIK